MVETVDERVIRLRAELERERDRYLHLGQRNYDWLMFFMALTVGSSALAGLLGLGFSGEPRLAFLGDPRFVGALALIPGICAAFVGQFRMQTKTDWHYRKYDAIKALLRRLNYDLPLKPTSEQIAEIGAALSKIEAEMTAAWEKAATFKFGGSQES